MVLLVVVKMMVDEVCYQRDSIVNYVSAGYYGLWSKK